MIFIFKKLIYESLIVLKKDRNMFNYKGRLIMLGILYIDTKIRNLNMSYSKIRKNYFLSLK